MKKVTIHQPEHLPYLGFFSKINNADELVILDSVNYKKNYFQNRNQIIGANGVQYITVPVTHTNGAINLVQIDFKHWRRTKKKNLNTIKQAYGKCEYFDDFYPQLAEVYSKDHIYLSEMNIDLIRLVFKYLQINVPFIRSSIIKASGAKTDLLVDICKKRNATSYLSGPSGKDYLELRKFGDIKVSFFSYECPKYDQKKNKFTPYMSIIDAIFHLGTNTLQLL